MSPEKRIRDAAIVVDSLPQHTMQDVLSYLDADSRRDLFDSMDELELVSGEELHRASCRFRQSTHHSPEPTPASKPTSKRPHAWPPKSLGPRSEPFAFLIHLQSDARQRLLEAEHPQNVAMVLAVISPAHASTITRELDPAFRVSVIRRLCEIDVIDDAKLMELRYELRLRANRMLVIEHCTKQGLSVAADLLSVSDRRTRDSIIAWLTDRDSELGHELQKRILDISDLKNFSDHQISKLLKRVDTSAWAGALRSTTASVAQHILKHMAPRAADIVTAEMESFDPLDEKAIQWANEQVMIAALKIKKEIPAADKPTWRVTKNTTKRKKKKSP